MNRVRFGVIGLGRFGEMHCEALAAMPEIELHSLCTRNPDRLAAFGSRFGVTRLHRDYGEMLADPGLDAVVVATMWRDHAAPTIAALRAGKHVFVEKPMASSAAECDAMIRARDESGRFCMTGHICRFNPRYRAAKREIEAGAVGRIVSMYARRNIPASVSETVLPKIGPIAGDGVHDTDLMLWLSGARIVDAYAKTHSVRGLANPDIGWTMYRFDNGAIGVCENVWMLPPGTPYRIDERMEIIGPAGCITSQESGPAISVSDASGWRAPDTTYWPLVDGERAGALRDELRYFASCVSDGRPPALVTLEDAAAAVRAVLAAEESARTGSAVTLPV